MTAVFSAICKDKNQEWVKKFVDFYRSLQGNRNHAGHGRIDSLDDNFFKEENKKNLLNLFDEIDRLLPEEEYKMDLD